MTKPEGKPGRSVVEVMICALAIIVLAGVAVPPSCSREATMAQKGEAKRQELAIHGR